MIEKPCIHIDYVVGSCSVVRAESWSLTPEEDNGVGCPWKRHVGTTESLKSVLDIGGTIGTGYEIRTYARCARRRNHRGWHGYSFRQPIKKFNLWLSRRR